MRHFTLRAASAPRSFASRHLTCRLLPALALVGALACSGESADETQLESLAGAECRPPQVEQVQVFEGIYERTLHSLNPSSCASDGEQLPASPNEPLLVVVSSDLFGAPVAAVRTCRDESDCQLVAAELRERARERSVERIDPPAPSPEYSALFQCQAETAALLRGGGASVANAGSDTGLCRLGHVDSSLQRSSDGHLRIERRTRAWTEPERVEGCVYDSTQVPADAPCAEREVFEAQLLSPL
jgi:hypothetical protein